MVNKPTGVLSWKGPYLQYKTSSYTMSHPKYKDIILHTLTDETDWGGTYPEGHYAPKGFCTSVTNCFLWIRINGFDDEKLAKNIDNVIDSGDGPKAGSLRWYYTANEAKWNYFYKYFVVTNPRK